MDRASFILCALAPAQNAAHTPVQVQKLIFLLDRNIASYVQGPLFHFEPYHYGPFDREVYSTLEQLAMDDMVEIGMEPLGRWNIYRLTQKGQQKGEGLLNSFPLEVKRFISNISGFVRQLSFTDLVSAIYKAYPEMKVNSVFQG